MNTDYPMPTENRSSNTEMVSVKRELLERCCMRPRLETQAVNDQDIIDRGRAQAELREILAKPAQHHGDAIGTLVRDYNERIVFTPIGDPHIIDDMKVYTHADPGEVERLRVIIRMHEITVREQADHLSYMRAQLAERDALLREASEWIKANSFGGTDAIDLYDRLDITAGGKG